MGYPYSAVRCLERRRLPPYVPHAAAAASPAASASSTAATHLGESHPCRYPCCCQYYRPRPRPAEPGQSTGVEGLGGDGLGDVLGGDGLDHLHRPHRSHRSRRSRPWDVLEAVMAPRAMWRKGLRGGPRERRHHTCPHPLPHPFPYSFAHPLLVSPPSPTRRRRMRTGRTRPFRRRRHHCSHHCHRHCHHHHHHHHHGPGWGPCGSARRIGTGTRPAPWSLHRHRRRRPRIVFATAPMHWFVSHGRRPTAKLRGKPRRRRRWPCTGAWTSGACCAWEGSSGHP